MNPHLDEKVRHKSKPRLRNARSTGQPGDELESWLSRKVNHPMHELYKRYILELIFHQKPLPPSQDGRHIPLRTEHAQPLTDERRGHAYISNSIRSSRYTIWDFLPKQFLFQATRLHNFYFICIGVPQTIPGLSTTGNYTTILPLSFFILLTMVKEAYDDYKRHKLDKIENNQLATVLRAKGEGDASTASESVLGRVRSLLQRTLCTPVAEAATDEKGEDMESEARWTKVRWHNIQVGDIVKLNRDDAVPAELALLHADGENGIAYIETMALDGETNLKSKQTPHSLRACSNIPGLESCSANFVCEDPNRNLYDFNGRLTVGDTVTPLTLNEILFRGSTLRNTPHVIGLVVNTGEECKIRMNANHHPKAKKPRLERYANQVVISLIVYVVLQSVGVSMGYLKWHREFETHAWYLNNAYVGFDEIIVGFLIMFNNVIPLALYVSLEIVKIGQLLMLCSDVELYDEATNTPMICNTNTILENLGQVSYVMSDKTGTLTENVMRFRGMSVGGVAITHGGAEMEKAGRPSQQGDALERRTGNGVSFDEKKPSFTITDRELSSSPDFASRPGRPSLQQRQSSAYSRRSRPGQNKSTTTEDLITYIQAHPSAAISRKARDFILAMALCHTALPEVSSDGSISFQASSPDELALLGAAQDLGYLLVQRSSQSITLLHTASDGTQARETYEVLDVIEFSSKRKRMTIIVRCPNGRIWLLCKGGDSVIVPRLQQAALASRKSQEVRRSVQIEREQRRSQQSDSRRSFSARPSLAVSRMSSMDIQPSAVNRSGLLDVPKVSHEVRVKTRSLDAPRGLRTSMQALERAAAIDDGDLFSQCFKHMDDFATQGLRTLLYAHKTVSAESYASWKRMYQDASTSLTDRQERIEAAADEIEHGLDLLGASAIEDKLQQGVPETIDKLRRANIKIWMLTGDKRETAINIAHSANLCKPESDMFVLDAAKGNLDSQLKGIDIDVRAGCLHSVLVIDGHTLSAVDESAELKHTFYSLIPLLDSVICCRASPAQKAGIVKAIRSRIPSALTLAIGDGANDVAMIQACHVGVGISGKEGLQAARVADYSIAQFHFLQRLLLVHGRWNYVRTAKFVLYTFWKEMFFYMMQALYQRYNGYTGTSLYENWSLTALNTLFTSLCVIVPGMLEQDLKAETLLAIPELYSYGQKNKGLNIPLFLLWMVQGTVQGMIVWFVLWAAFGHFAQTSDNGLFALGDLAFSLGILWTNIKLLILETHHKTRVVGFSFTIVFAGWWAWNGFMCGIYSDNLSPYDVKGGFTGTFGNDPIWWLTLIAVLATLTVLDLGFKSIKQSLVMAGRWPPWKRRLRGDGARESGPGELDVGYWQAMEQDVQGRAYLEELSGREGSDDVDDGDLNMRNG